MLGDDVTFLWIHTLVYMWDRGNRLLVNCSKVKLLIVSLFSDKKSNQFFLRRVWWNACGWIQFGATLLRWFYIPECAWRVSVSLEWRSGWLHTVSASLWMWQQAVRKGNVFVSGVSQQDWVWWEVDPQTGIGGSDSACGREDSKL